MFPSINSINTKVVLGYLAVLLMIGVSAVFLFSRANEVSRMSQRFVDVQLPNMNASASLETLLAKLELAVYELYGTTSTPTEFDARKAQLDGDIQALLSRLEASKQDLSSIRADLSKLDESVLQVGKIMAADQIDWDQARTDLAEVSALSRQIQSALAEQKTDISGDAAQGSQHIGQLLESMKSLILAAVGAVVAITLVAYFSARQTIAKPVHNLADQLIRLTSDKDLRRPLMTKSRDEIGMVARSMNGLLSAFADELRKLSDTVGIVGQTAGDVDRTSNQTDVEASKLSSSVDSLTATITRVESSIGDCANRSTEASDMAKKGASQIAEGATELAATSAHITSLATDIEHSSELLMELKTSGNSVVNVVRSISEIAEQTNLLALNAAIEAARAGESGRGFAVVADEVRTLATRTQDATVEINQILEQIVTSIAETVSTMETNQVQAQTTVQLAQSTVVTLDTTRQTIEDLSVENESLAQASRMNAEQANQMRQEVESINLCRSALNNTSIASREVSSRLSALASSLKSSVELFKA